MACQHRLIGLETNLGFRVLRGSLEKRDLATAVIADEVLDHRLHAGPIVEHQARNAGQLDADAAHPGVRESLDEPRDAARPTVGRQQRRHDDDAVDGVGAKQLVDGVVGGVQWLRGFHRPAVNQQQMMAGLAALRMNGIAKLRFIPAAEGIQVIEQHRDAKPHAALSPPPWRGIIDGSPANLRPNDVGGCERRPSHQPGTVTACASQWGRAAIRAARRGFGASCRSAAWPRPAGEAGRSRTPHRAPRRSRPRGWSCAAPSA